MPMNSHTRVAVVTGSGQGIGRETALKLADMGCNIVITDVNMAAAREVAAEVESRNVKSLAIEANVAVAEQVSKLVSETISALGRVDILVNNAGITRDTLLLRMSEADWDQVITVNLKGAFLCTQVVLRHMMKQRWGRIVNIASVVGLMGNAGQANYSAAKAGIIGLTKTTAREGASRGITANAIAPGFIDTGMTGKLNEEVKHLYISQIPLGTFGTPTDVAHAVAFFASEESHYITGQVLNVDGGMVMA
jgi:3-oxoacyl-[acyl-carrier protein] reductase